MAANVQWELYDCGDGAGGMRGLWVKMLHNEREVPFPACSVGGGDDAARAWVEPEGNAAAGPFGLRFPCPWDTVKSYYRDTVYARHGIGTCDAETFETMCGGLSYDCETDEGLLAAERARA